MGAELEKMGKGQCDCNDGKKCCEIHTPLWRAEFIGACFLLAISFAWFVCCLDGLNKMPKCRYGENDCYFVRRQCDFMGKNCGMVFKNRAVEGDSDSSLEQLAIPFLVTLVSLLPPLLIFFATLCGRTLKTIEVGKYFLTGCSVTMLFSIRIVDQLSFDCRWWNNEYQDKCKAAFNTFAAGAFFTILTEISLLTVAVFHGDKERHVEFDDYTSRGDREPYRDRPQGTFSDHATSQMEAQDRAREVEVDMQERP